MRRGRLARVGSRRRPRRPAVRRPASRQAAAGRRRSGRRGRRRDMELHERNYADARAARPHYQRQRGRRRRAHPRRRRHRLRHAPRAEARRERPLSPRTALRRRRRRRRARPGAARRGRNHDMKWTALLLAALALPLTADEHFGAIVFPNGGKPEAQEAFLRGVLLLHNFAYPQAERAFKEAEGIDPSFALAYWGEAMTYNNPIW